MAGVDNIRQFECVECGEVFAGFREMVGAVDVSGFGPQQRESRIFPAHCPGCNNPTNEESFMKTIEPEKKRKVTR